MADTARAQYDPRDLKSVIRAYKAMSDDAQAEGKRVGYDLAQMLLQKIKDSAKTPHEIAIAATGRASKSSKVGEFMFGYTRKAFSGGASTAKNYQYQGGDGILAGVEFGSNVYFQFRERSPRVGRGNQGYWIYPTLEREQPAIIREWEKAFGKIIGVW